MGEAPLEGHSRIQLVIAHAGLRQDLSRALEASGYRVDSSSSLSCEGVVANALGHAARVLDLDAFADSDLRATFASDRAFERTIWLRGGVTSGGEVLPVQADVLAKPFSIRTLEARLRACLERDRDAAERLHDPILQTADPDFAATLSRAWRLALTDRAVVLEGELGSGRRALARAIHTVSERGREPFSVLDRGEIEAAGIASQADRVRAAVARTHGGSLVLLEPGDWTETAQRALASQLRLASTDIRCLTVARRPLENEVGEGSMLVELQYRLDTASLFVPPLRTRVADHEKLCLVIARRVARSLGRPTPVLEPHHVEAFAAEGFPGNRIGLESRLRSAIVRQEVGLVGSEDIESLESADPAGRAKEAARTLDLKTLERDTIVRALAHWQGNRTRASESLGISVRTLRNKIRDYGLR